MYTVKVTTVGPADKLFPVFLNGDYFMSMYIDVSKRIEWFNTCPGFISNTHTVSTDKTVVTSIYVFDSEANARAFNPTAMPASGYRPNRSEQDRAEYTASQGITRTLEYLPA